jgi:muramoyltetrapeptide carboxypeptidase
MRSPVSDPLSAPAQWPPPLRPGGTIGICSPAGPSDPQSIAAAAAALRARGYGVVLAPHAAGAHPPDRPYLGGTDADRLADLNALLADPGVDLILCARGGYGTMRLLDRVDYAAAAARPKAVVGYSDITALQLALAAKAGVVSFSGPMATAGHGLGEASLDPWSEASLWAAVGPGAFPRVLGSPGDAPPWRIERPPLSGGAMLSGTLFPVCLTLLASLAGTPFVPDLRGAVLVIEDVHEDLYAVDRYLTQLRLAACSTASPAC